MRCTHRAACLITVAITGLAPMTTAAAAPGSPARAMAHAAKGCITVTATIPVGSFPQGVAADPKTNTIYVTNDYDNTVSVSSGRTNTVTTTTPVGNSPEEVAVNPKTNTIYVTNLLSHTVSVISGQTNTVTATIPVGNFPVGVAADPKTNTAYVTND